MDQYRKTPRANWIDYDNGMYFITICTKNRKHYFGRVVGCDVDLSPIGEIVNYNLEHASQYCDYVEVPLYVVMPNHIHLMVYCATDKDEDIPNEQRHPNPSKRADTSGKRYVPALTRYISMLKGAVTKQAKKIDPTFAWQTRYFDRLVRGEKEYRLIADYIRNIPITWPHDSLNDPAL